MLREKYLPSTRTAEHAHNMGGTKTLYSRNSLRTAENLNLNLTILFLTLTFILLFSEQTWLNVNIYNSTIFFITLLLQNSISYKKKIALTVHLPIIVIIIIICSVTKNVSHILNHHLKYNIIP